MNLLGAANYDPAVAVSKATSALLAMTALDTTNLRLAITVPAHGIVLFKLSGTITGATTLPTILVGVLNGATVLGRDTPMIFTGTQNATTQGCPFTAEFIATGLAPGAMNVDAAYAVQVVVALTNIKYGGPNNNSGANAWGGFSFEAWDPRPVPTATPGAANGLLIAGANAATTFATLTSTGAFSVNGVNAVSQTGDSFARIGAAGVGLTNLGDARLADLDAAVSSRMATYAQPTGFLAATFPSGTIANTTNITAGIITTTTNLTNLPAIPNNWLTAAGIAASALNGKGDWPVGKTGYSISGTITTLDGLATHGDSTWSTATGFATPTNITAGIITTVSGNVSGSVGSVVGLTASNLDATVSSRLASASYTAPDNADITSIKTTIGVDGVGLTNLGDARLAHLDADVSSRSTFAGGAVASVTGDVGGNVTGSVGSINGVTFPTHFGSLAIDVGGDVTFNNSSIATVTNLTNAPTAGDFTAAMKASLNASMPTVVSIDHVVNDVDGKVVGSVGSVIAPVNVLLPSQPGRRA